MIDRDILPSLWMCGLLVIASGWMMRSHLGTWRTIRADESKEAYERNYHRRRFYRRMQTSGLLGLLGIAILIGHFITPMANVVVAVYWASVLLMVAWTLVLAFFDAISTQMHFNRIRRRNESEQALLEARRRRAEKEALIDGGSGQDESAD